VRFKLPDFSRFDKSYREVCIERAIELNELSNSTKKPIIVLWSGGIDSTTVIVSLLLTTNNYDNIIIALNGLAISENYRFYKDHIFPNFKIMSSDIVFENFNTDNIIVGGEFNDQLFGADFIEKFQKQYTMKQAKSALNSDLIVDFFVKQGLNKDNAIKWFELLKNSIDNYNSDLVLTNYDFFWWYNFTQKWQHVYFRTLLSCDHLTDEFLDNNYQQFFNTTNFQLWSMNSGDQKIGNSWSEYKQIAKQFIFDYNRDDDYYRNKVKIGSLYHILSKRKTYPLGITSDLKFIYELDPNQYYNSDNSFL
jgi:hypothetical protein